MPFCDLSTPTHSRFRAWPRPTLSPRRDIPHDEGMPETDLLLRPSDSKPDASDNPDRARILPSNLEAEAAFLGAVLIDNKVIEELQTAIQPGHFHEPVHQRIYERVLKLIERNSIATPVTLKPYFE